MALLSSGCRATVDSVEGLPNVQNSSTTQQWQSYLAGWQLHVPCRQSSKHFHFRSIKSYSVIPLFRYSVFRVLQRPGGGGAYTRDATISLAITPSLPVKHDSIVICRWGVEAKREVSPNARRRDAPDASGGLTSFNIEGRESRALPRI